MSRAVPAPAAAAREEREGGRESRGVAEPDSPLAASPRGLEAVARGDRTGRPLPITAPSVRFPHPSSLFFPSPIPSPAPSSSFPSPLPAFTSLLSLQPRPRPHLVFTRSTPSPQPPAPPAVLLAPHGFSATLPSPPRARRLVRRLPTSSPSWRHPSAPPAFRRCPRAALAPSASPASHFEAFCKPLPELPLSSLFFSSSDLQLSLFYVFVHFASKLPFLFPLTLSFLGLRIPKLGLRPFMRVEVPCGVRKSLPNHSANRDLFALHPVCLLTVRARLTPFCLYRFLSRLPPLMHPAPVLLSPPKDPETHAHPSGIRSLSVRG